MSFTVLAMFKNESHAINEWIKHYLSEGASKIVLADNDSDDGYEDILLDEYKNNPQIKIYKYPGKFLGIQTSIYNDIFKKYGFNTKWLLTCDIDEFIYSRNEYKTIKQYLNSITDPNISSIKIPWKMFNSSCHIEQPDSIIEGFTSRRRQEEFNTFKDGKVETKSITRVDRLRKIDIHFDYITKGKIIRPSGSIELANPFTFKSEETVNKESLHLNHYVIQSKNWFLKVKCTRGDSNQHKNVRDMNYFEKYDKGTTIDEELKNKRYDE